MSFNAPLTLGPFAVDAEGRLSPHLSATTSPILLFRWRDRVVRAQIDQAGAAEGRIGLETTLGRVPSTASVAESAMRPRSFAMLRWMPRSVPAHWSVHLLADHRVRLHTETRITLPITATALLTELTLFLLELTPYLDLLDDEGLTGPTVVDQRDRPRTAAHAIATAIAPAST